MKVKLILFFLIQPIILQAQTPETVIAKAYYDFHHQLDSTDKGSIRRESMVLYMGRHSSMFTSRDRELNLERAAKLMKDPSANPQVKLPNANRGTHYYYKSERKWITSVALGANYAFEIEQPVIHWQISEESRSLSGWICQKATGLWKGREYTAWFCPDLPFTFGPWKLHGLPGLILEAYDSKGEVRFRYAGYESYLLADKTTALPDYKLTMTTEEKVTKLIESINTNPSAHLQQLMPGFTKVETRSIGGATNKNSRPVPKMNNPLELTK